jgi:aspartate ammonia-lyase
VICLCARDIDHFAPLCAYIPVQPLNVTQITSSFCKVNRIGQMSESVRSALVRKAAELSQVNLKGRTKLSTTVVVRGQKHEGYLAVVASMLLSALPGADRSRELGLPFE